MLPVPVVNWDDHLCPSKVLVVWWIWKEKLPRVGITRQRPRGEGRLWGGSRPSFEERRSMSSWKVVQARRGQGPGQFWSSGSRFLIFDLNFRENFSEPTSAKIVGFHGLWSLKNSWKRFPNEIPAWCHLQRVAENSFFIKFKGEQLNLSLLSIIFTIVHVQFNTSSRLNFPTKQQ